MSKQSSCLATLFRVAFIGMLLFEVGGRAFFFLGLLLGADSRMPSADDFLFWLLLPLPIFSVGAVWSLFFYPVFFLYALFFLAIFSFPAGVVCLIYEGIMRDAFVQRNSKRMPIIDGIAYWIILTILFFFCGLYYLGRPAYDWLCLFLASLIGAVVFTLIRANSQRIFNGLKKAASFLKKITHRT